MFDDGSVYDHGFDFRNYDGERKTYMIATTPRSGSTFLSALLWKMGCFGSPLEYLNWEINGKRLDGFAGNVIEYWEDVVSRRTSPNGVFGWKMFPRNFTDIRDRAPEMLTQLAPQHVLYLRRSNEAEHAVSYWRAIETQSWFSGVPERKELTFDQEGIARARDLLRHQDQMWLEIFNLTNTTPIEILYEDLLLDAGQVVARVATELAVSIEDAEPLQKVALPAVQRNEKTMKWAQHFSAEEQWHFLASLTSRGRD